MSMWTNMHVLFGREKKNLSVLWKKIQVWSRPVVKKLYTVLFRREKKGHRTVVPSRSAQKFHTHRPVPSHPTNYKLHFIAVPSRLVLFSHQLWQKSPVLSRILPTMKSLGLFIASLFSWHVLVRSSLNVPNRDGADVIDGRMHNAMTKGLQIRYQKSIKDCKDLGR